jgi:regulator-associated protein of mTOR
MQISFVLIAGSGLVIDWEQESGRLLASGDVRYIRVWDSKQSYILTGIKLV